MSSLRRCNASPVVVFFYARCFVYQIGVLRAQTSISKCTLACCLLFCTVIPSQNVLTVSRSHLHLRSHLSQSYCCTAVCNVILFFTILLPMSQLWSRFSKQQLLLPTLSFQYKVYKRETPTVFGKSRFINISSTSCQCDSHATRPSIISCRISTIASPSLS